MQGERQHRCLPNASDAAEEVKKLKLAVKYGADTVMDLSTGGVNLDEVRTAIIDASPVDRTVPVYQALESVHGSIEKLDEDDFSTSSRNTVSRASTTRPSMLVC